MDGSKPFFFDVYIIADFSNSFSVLPALLLCDSMEGSFSMETFLKFIDSLLDNMQPYPAANSVILMDNCQIHKHPEIWERIYAR